MDVPKIEQSTGERTRFQMQGRLRGRSKLGTLFCAGQFGTVFEAKREFQVYLSLNRLAWLRKVTVNSVFLFQPQICPSLFSQKNVASLNLTIFFFTLKGMVSPKAYYESKRIMTQNFKNFNYLTYIHSNPSLCTFVDIVNVILGEARNIRS